MRHCIPCGSTFEDENVKRCPDCDGRLVSDEERTLWLDARDELTNQSFVPILLLSSPVERAIVPSILEDAGIPYVIHGDFFSALSAAFLAQQGWGVLLVPDEDLERARAIIKLYRESTVPDEPEEAEGPDEPTA